MSTPFRLKRSAVSGKRPGLSDLQKGELALNFNDGYLFAERDTGGVGIGTTITLLTPWTENFGATSIYYENSVGIGTTNPTVTLDINGDINVSGVSTFVGVSTFQDKVVFDSTNSIQIPVGDTSQRDPSPIAGQIRYNSELSSFEGYGPGNAWGSLGGVKDVDGDTYIKPEISAGSDEDILYFYNAGSNTATISSTTATFNVDLSVTGDISFTGDLIQNGSLFGIGIHSEGTVIVGSGTTIIDFVGSAISSITSSSGIATVFIERGEFTRTTTAFTATEGQTIFTIDYTPGYIDVYVNGVRLTASEYTATNGTTVILSTGTIAGDTVDITVYQDDGLYSGSKWTPGNGNDIYRLNGNVGIGTDTGTARLDIEGVLGLDTTVTEISTTSATTIDTLPTATYRSSRFQVQITQGTDYQSSDLMVIHDGSTSNLIEYGSIATNSYLATFSSTISGSNLLLQASMVSAGIATVKVVRYGITL